MLSGMATVEKQVMPYIIADLLREQAITMDNPAEFRAKSREIIAEMQSRSEIGDFRVRCADCHGSNRRFEARHR